MSAGRRRGDSGQPADQQPEHHERQANEERNEADGERQVATVECGSCAPKSLPVDDLPPGVGAASAWTSPPVLVVSVPSPAAVSVSVSAVGAAGAPDAAAGAAVAAAAGRLVGAAGGIGWLATAPLPSSAAAPVGIGDCAANCCPDTARSALAAPPVANGRPRLPESDEDGDAEGGEPGTQRRRRS